MYTNRIFRLLAVTTLALAGVLALLFILPSSSPDAAQASERDPLQGAGVEAPTTSTVRYVATTGLDAGDCANSANPCRTVQYAVDVADSSDEIKVATGVYTGVNSRPAPAGYIGPATIEQAVYLSKTLTIQGGYTTTNWSAPNPISYPTTLDAQGQGRVFCIFGGISPTIEGLHLTNGSAAGLGGRPGPDDSGGGVYAVTATITLSNNQVSNNSAVYGGGLFLDHGAAMLDANLITSNVADSSGGGLYLLFSDATLSANVVASNTAHFGGGLCGGDGTLLLRANTFVSNTATGLGGGLDVGNGNITLERNTITANLADNGGGLAFMNYPGEVKAITMTANLVLSNTSNNAGGGLYFAFGPVALGQNIIMSNTADLGGGLAIVSSTTTLANNIVANNHATSQGSGLAIENTLLQLLHTTIANNTGGDGSGVWVTNQGSSYSAVAMTNTILVSQTIGITITASNTATLNGVLWHANTANYGGTGVITVTNTITGDPDFTCQGTACSAPYRIGPSSAAIDAGVDAGVTTDIDGDPRPLGNGYDIGADEFYGIGVYLVPPSQAGSGGPGATVSYTVELINQTGITDSFGLSIQPGNAWTTTLSLTQTGALPNGASLPFTVEVEIPSSALPGDWDSVTIQAASVTSPTVYSDIAVFTTTAHINAAPIAVDDSGLGFITDEDTAFTTASVLTNDTDPDGDQLSVQSFDASGTLGLVSFGSGAAGSLDTSGFGAPNGYVTTNFGDYEHGYSVAIQPDGKIVVAGDTGDNMGTSADLAVTRYNPDGSLDTSFDGDGKVTTNFGNYDSAYGVVVQSDGKIVVAGYADSGGNSDFAIVRYNPDGSLDTSFDGDGKVTTDFGFYDGAQSVTIQSDNKLVVIGIAYNGINMDFGVARYNPDGSLDTTFNDDGKVTTDFGFQDNGQSIVVQSDGKIVVAGMTFNGSNVDFAVTRYNPNGSLDTSFDGDGKVVTDFFGGHDYGTGVIIQPDDKLIVAGRTNDNDFALARYNSNGSLDTTFDGDGKATADFGFSDYGYSVAIQPDGKIIMVGYSANYPASIDLALARYNTDGSLDATFDGDGKVTTDLGGMEYGYDVAIQSDGNIVVAGSNDYDFIVARYTAGSSNAFIYDPNDQFEWLAAGQVATDTFTYIVSDGALTDTATVSITIVGVNDAPVLSPIGDKSVDEGIQLTFTVTATEVDLSDNLTFALDAGAPGGASLTPGGEFAWTPTEAQGPGVYTTTIRVSDGELDDAETITITVSEVNVAPVLAPIGDENVDELATLVFTATATDGDIPTQTLTFSLDAGSVGNITPGGVFTWTPQAPGTYTATVRVTDDGAPLLSDAETITITVNQVIAAPGVPVLLSPFSGTVTTTQAITLTWQASPGDPPIGYNLLLDGEVITTSATFSATFLPIGVHTWTVRAYNAAGYSAWASPTWTIEVIRHRIYLPLVLR